MAVGILVAAACSGGDDATNDDDGGGAANDGPDALAGSGIDRDRITTSGRGEDEPAVPNTMPDGSDDPAGRQLNRRVEILIRTDEPIPGS